jgi:hypothetical protein
MFLFFFKFLIIIQLHLLIALEGDFSCLEINLHLIFNCAKGQLCATCFRCPSKICKICMLSALLEANSKIASSPPLWQLIILRL